MLSWASGRAPVGGAELGHLELELQRRLKTEVLRELLGGIGGFEPEQLEALDPRVEALPGETDDGLGWRTRAHFAVDEQGRAAMHPHRSDELVPVQDFPLMTPALSALRIGEIDWSGATRLDLAGPSADAPAVVVTAAVRALADRGLVDDAGLTEEGAELRARLEVHTDALSADPWLLLGPERTARVVELGKHFSRQLVANGALSASGLARG